MAAMSLLLTAEDSQRTRLRARVLNLLTTRRMNRIVLGIASFLFVATLIYWHFTEEPIQFPNLRSLENLDLYPYVTSSDFHPVSIDPTGKSTQELCATFPMNLLEFVQPVLKLGYGDHDDRLDAQFNSLSACFSPGELLISSDVEKTIYNHSSIDVLADLPERYYDVAYNPGIKNYLLLKELEANGSLGADEEAMKKIDGWAMDKFKFLPQIERAWRLRPNRPFYFFYETDTYVFWDNVFRFLQTFDPDAPIYMGSPSPGRHEERRGITTYFANGGPGFVISRGAMKMLLNRKTSENGQYNQPSVTEKWLPVLTHDCCGDSVTGWALWNAGVALQGYWPMFNPHPLHDIPFGDPFWCQPVLTLHKTSPEDMREVWRWEFGQRRSERPLLYSDLIDFHHPGTQATKERWDNGDWNSWMPDAEVDINSAEACEQACKQDGDCLQWNWRPRDDRNCLLMRTIRYGYERGEEFKDWKAGWIEDRIDKWREANECQRVEWVGPSVVRST